MRSFVFLVQRIGPYHHARLAALADRFPGSVTALEFRPEDRTYAWSSVESSGAYARRATRSRTELYQALEDISADAVVCTGYSDPEIHYAAAWALGRGCPLVTCSDSTHESVPRLWIKEAFKRQVVAAFDSALVAGKRARDYMGALGMNKAFCFGPWDVVDNAHFARVANEGRLNADAVRSRLGLPKNYFLGVARFITRKNLAMLVEAFGRYAAKAGPAAWSLVLSGSGPQEAELRRRAVESSVGDKVVFPGFLQYGDLPACYGLARALVLPSLADEWGLVVNEAMASGLPVVVSEPCGCVPDLVRNWENGFVFDPRSVESLEICLTRLAAFDPFRRERMAERSREIISGYSPAAFAEGLDDAVTCACSRRRGRRPRHARVIMRFLAAREVKA